MTRTDLSSAPWLDWPGTRAVMAALEAARPGGACFVGGCVRNALRGLEVDDIDIATQLTPEATLAALQAADIRAILRMPINGHNISGVFRDDHLFLE